MKLTSAKIFTLLLVILCAIALFSCDSNGNSENNGYNKPIVENPTPENPDVDEEKTPHQHSFTNYKTDNNATCTVDGTKTAKCDKCYETDTVADIGSAGHQFTNYISNNNTTCTAYGTKSAKCNNCEEIDVQVDIDIKPAHKKISHEAKNPTCTDIGRYAYETCSSCDFTTYSEIAPLGHSFSKTANDENNHWTECIRCDAKKGITTHEFNSDSICYCGYGCEHIEGTAATCEKQAVCSKCGNSYGTLANHTSIEIPAVVPSCTESGLTAGIKCSVCNIILAAQSIVKKLGHSFGEYVSDNNATCTQNGTKTAKCDRCEVTDTKSDVHSKLGHLFTNYISDNNAEVGKDGTKTAKCDRCDTTETITDEGSALEEQKYSEGLAFTLNEDGESYSVTGIGTCTDMDLRIPPMYESKPVIRVDHGAFYGCTGITNITIPDSIREIGNGSFRECSNVKSVKIGSGMTKIYSEVFLNCSNLDTISVDEENETYHVTMNCLIETATKILVVGTNNGVIPDDGSVTIIGDYAFYGRSGPKNIVIPDCVTNINYAAFEGCSGLKNVTVSNNVKVIDHYAFASSGLVKIEIPDNVTTISGCAFEGCMNLKDVKIGKGVASISQSSFYSCINLESITVDAGNTVYKSSGNCLIEISSKTLILGCKNSVIPENGSVTTIGNYAFLSCIGLKSITIPNSVTSILDYAFAYCLNLVEVCNKSSLNILKGSTSHGNIALYALNVYTPSTGESKIHTIDNYVFYEDGETVYLIDYIGNAVQLIFPEKYNNKVYSVYQYAFFMSNNITSITLNSSITSIGMATFTSCTKVKSIVIDKSTTSIGANALTACIDLINITYNGTTDEWNCISKTEGWNESTGEYRIYCIDGTISKDGTVTSNS